LLLAAIDDKYSLKLQFVTTYASGIDKALKSFVQAKEKIDEEKLKLDPKYQANSIETDRVIYLQDLKKNATFKEIVSNSNFFVADVMQSATEGTALHDLVIAIETHNRETALAKSQRAETANKILANWHEHGHGSVGADNTEKNDTQPNFSKITVQSRNKCNGL